MATFQSSNTQKKTTTNTSEEPKYQKNDIVIINENYPEKHVHKREGKVHRKCPGKFENEFLYVVVINEEDRNLLLKENELNLQTKRMKEISENYVI